jgi:FkbM family methyltransferase
MSGIKSFLRQWLPFGLIERRRRDFRLSRLGLFPRPSERAEYDAAVKECRFEMWPGWLRDGQDWTLIDVGANEGDFIRASLRLATPAAVIGLEPLPACHPTLSKLFESIPAGQLLCAAAGAAVATLAFNCTSNTKMSSLLVPEKNLAHAYHEEDLLVRERIEVPVVRLDDVIPASANVGLLKVDVQGYEIEVFKGGTRVLGQTKAVLVEVNFVPHYEGATLFDDLHSFLVAAGFSLYGISAPYIGGGRPLWADAMYVRGDPHPW